MKRKERTAKAGTSHFRAVTRTDSLFCGTNELFGTLSTALTEPIYNPMEIEDDMAAIGE